MTSIGVGRFWTWVHWCFITQAVRTTQTIEIHGFYTTAMEITAKTWFFVIIMGNVIESTKFCGRQCESIKKIWKPMQVQKNIQKTPQIKENHWKLDQPKLHSMSSGNPTDVGSRRRQPINYHLLWCVIKYTSGSPRVVIWHMSSYKNKETIIVLETLKVAKGAA